MRGGRRSSIGATALVALLLLTGWASGPVAAGPTAAGASAEASASAHLHDGWWLVWSRDADRDRIDDQLEWKIAQPVERTSEFWRRAEAGEARVFVDYDHPPTDADVQALLDLGIAVTYRARHLDLVATTMDIDLLDDVLALPGVVMLEDIGLAVTHMHEAVPAMGVDTVWEEQAYRGEGAVVAILDTGVRGDHEGLNDLDDDPLTCADDPVPTPGADCDPKIIAFYDAVYTHGELPPEQSYDSGTHGSHVAGIVAGTGGGQTAPDGTPYIGAAPQANLVTILACCEGDIQDIIEGAEWAMDHAERIGIDILTSSLGEQQLEVHLDNDGRSAWSRAMDELVLSGIIVTLSAGNEFGGATVAGCNTIDSPGDARLPVTVASLDKDLGLAIYSSRGYTSDGRVKPDVATIGSSIMAPDAVTQDGYTSKSGTSSTLR